MEINTDKSLRVANPSAFAKSDCHTCTNRKETCDRSRPRCGNCERSGVRCGGFAMKLSWQQGFSTSRKPVKRSINHQNKRRSASRQQFDFIAESPAKRPKGGDLLFPTGPKPPPDYFVNHRPESGKVIKQVDEVANWPSVGRISLLDDARIRSNSIHTIEDEERDISEALTDSESQSLLSRSAEIATNLDLHQDVFRRVELPITRTPSGVFEKTFPRIKDITLGSLLQKYEPLFDRYNKEFCILPLTTSDMHLNPFRYHPNARKQSLYLAHAVMALTCHHLSNRSCNERQHLEKVSHHHQTALHLFHQSLNIQTLAQSSQALLDTIIILFSFDETQSALGNWTTHLKGAFSVIEACGGILRWIRSAKAVVQIGMLVWWDAVTALISREGCVFPYSYFNVVQESHDDSHWTFFALCGCPQSLVGPLIQLAHLAAEKQKTSSMCSVVFDTASVSEIERSLESWAHISPEIAFKDEERMHQDQDMMHCSEAWRYGLLLYIYRIFWWVPGSKVPAQVAFRARSAIDHVFACREDVNVSKQALLPLFLGGCELKNSSLRARITSFCATWGRKSGYHMFNSTIPLLEEVWADQEAAGFDYVWWGQVVDRKHLEESSQSLEVRFTFG